MLFECNEALVLEAFRRGEFDYVDASARSRSGFLPGITERKILSKLAESYPSPARDMTCPCGCTWPAICRCVFTASIISMRFPTWCARRDDSGIWSAMGHKAIHPETGDVSLRCEGFNEKNEYDRQTPCDQTTCARWLGIRGALARDLVQSQRSGCV